MKKNLLTTICTFAIAGAIIAGSTGLTASALAANKTETPISAEKVIQLAVNNSQTPISAENLIQPETEPDSAVNQSKVTISSMEDAPDMAALRTSADMDKEKATYIALEALEKKFDISLDGNYATPILCTRTDYDGLVYFVSFVELDSMATLKEAVSKESENNTDVDVYIAFVDSKTGEVISAEKNPVAVEDGSGGLG